MKKSERIKKPLHWSLEHYPYFNVWGDVPARPETQVEQIGFNLAAAGWYNRKAREAYSEKNRAAGMGYLALQRQRVRDALDC